MFMESMNPSRNITVLDLCMTCDETHVQSNFFEKRYPHKHMIVCAGLEGGGFREKQHPGAFPFKLDA